MVVAGVNGENTAKKGILLTDGEEEGTFQMVAVDDPAASNTRENELKPNGGFVMIF